jgi:hypothetical protein
MYLERKNPMTPERHVETISRTVPVASPFSKPGSLKVPAEAAAGTVGIKTE